MKHANYPPVSFNAYWGSILFSMDYKFDDAENKLKQALSDDPENMTFILLLAQLYQKKLQYDDSNQNTLSVETRLADCAQRGISVLRRKPVAIWNDSDFRNMGEFELLLVRFDEARRSFEQALEINPNLFEAKFGLGIACQKASQWSEALTAFEQARRLDSNDLDVRCSLAEVMIELKQFSQAEEQLAFVRCITDEKHVDALILSGKLYSRLGDLARDDDNISEAEGRYDWAVKFSNTALEAETYGDYSRKITPYERNTVRYLNGYCQVRLLQTREKKRTIVERFGFIKNSQPTIKKALNQFKKIAESKRAHNLFEAKQAISQLEKYKEDTGLVKRTGPQGVKGYVVALFAFCVLVVAQFFFWLQDTGYVRYIAEPTPEYYIQPGPIKSALKLSALNTVQLDKFCKLKFGDKEELIADWDKKMGENVPFERDWIKNASPKSERIFSEWLFSFLTFGSLLFIIAGLVLPELTKLKVGSIELEKAKLETITSTPSLTISGGASASRSPGR